MAPYEIVTLLGCFAGGVVGAALGGLFSFAMCGLIVLAGCVVALSGGGTFLLTEVGFGPLFGPHTGGFSAGVVAATYAAAIRRNHPTGNAKDIPVPLMATSWDVLFVGGLAAVVGHVGLHLIKDLPVIAKADCIAVWVALLAIFSRALFQRQSPFGAGESIRRFGLLGTDDTRISWVPWLLPLPKMALFGAAAGMLAGVTALRITSNDSLATAGVSPDDARSVATVIWWALAAVSLIGLNLSTGPVQRFPVWHCPTIIGALAALHFDHWAAGLVAGAAAMLLQELSARLFWNHGANHIDPPAVAIAVGTLIVNVLPNGA